MAELPSAKPDLTDLRWEPASGDQAEPTEGQKDDGWAVNQKVPSKELNWRWAQQYLLLTWLAGLVLREFSTVREGIAAVAELGTFRVRQTVDNASARGAQKVFTDTQGTSGAVAITCMCTDGSLIFYAQGSEIHAAHPGTGAHVWTYDTNANTVLGIATDGYRVYVGRDIDDTDEELEALDPATGTRQAATTSATAVSAVAANGAKLVAAIGNSAYIYTVNPTSLVNDGNLSHTAAIYAVAIDDTTAYVGGVRGTDSKDLRAVSLATQAEQWSVALPTTAAPVVNGIAMDGETIYVVTDSVTTAGGTASLFAHGPLGGETLWDTLGGFNHDRVYVDDHYVLAVRDNGDSFMVHRRDGVTFGIFGSGTMSEVWGLDPVAAIVTNGVYDFNRIYLGYPTRIVQAATVTDIKRRPYYAAAVPI